MTNLATRHLAIMVIDWCPQCETQVQLIDRDGLLACPNCGYLPAVSAGLTAEDWLTLLTAPSESLTETAWRDLLEQIDHLGPEVT